MIRSASFERIICAVKFCTEVLTLLKNGVTEIKVFKQQNEINQIKLLFPY